MPVRLRDLIAARIERENPGPARAWALAEAAYAHVGNDAARGFVAFRALLAQEPELEQEFTSILRKNWLATAIVEDALLAGWRYDAATANWTPPPGDARED